MMETGKSTVAKNAGGRQMSSMRFLPGIGLDQFVAKGNHLASHACGKSKKIERPPGYVRAHAALGLLLPFILQTPALASASNWLQADGGRIRLITIGAPD